MSTQGAKTPNLLCPFTGRPIGIRQLGGGLGWMGIVERSSSDPGEGGYSTTIFQTKDALIYFLSTRNGVKPAFPIYTPITVTESVRPPSPELMGIQSGADLVREEDEIVNEAAEKILADRRVRKLAAAVRSGAGG